MASPNNFPLHFSLLAVSQKQAKPQKSQRAGSLRITPLAWLYFQLFTLAFPYFGFICFWPRLCFSFSPFQHLAIPLGYLLADSVGFDLRP